MIVPTRAARWLAIPLVAAALTVVSCSSGTGPADSPTAPSDTSGASGSSNSTAEPSTPATLPAPLGAAELTAACTSGTNPIDRVGPEQVDRPVVVVDPEGDQLCLGPVVLTGDVIETAQATLEASGAWVVALEFTPDGIDRFNEIAQLCYDTVAGVCPSGRLALLVDGAVATAPSIEASSFLRDQIQISGDFTQDEAAALATAVGEGGLTFRLVLSILA